MVGGGASQVAAARALGVHKNTVSLWLKAWRQGGERALEAERRGRPPGEQKRLSAAQGQTNKGREALKWHGVRAIETGSSTSCHSSSLRL